MYQYAMICKVVDHIHHILHIFYIKKKEKYAELAKRVEQETSI
jgi:hypothetical protein